MKSKTIWFNILSGAATVVAALSGQPIPADIAAVSIAVINIIIKACSLSKESAK